jgi:hypothetical protein
MRLFIDRWPFDQWTDPTRTPALTYGTVVLPVIRTVAGRLYVPVRDADLWPVDPADLPEKPDKPDISRFVHLKKSRRKETAAR